MLNYKHIQLAMLVLVGLLCPQLNHAQTIVWGVGSATGTADAEFQNSFVNSTTASNYSITQWTALAVNQTGGGVDSAYWERTTTASRGAYGQVTPSSPSQANGAALFDSDFLDNRGAPGALGTGASPSPHRGELISPRIDLTGYTDSALVVKFYTNWRNFQANFKVSLSVDDGLSWIDVDVQTLVPSVQAANSPSEGWAIAPFYTSTAGLANLTQCRLRFVFDGDYYHAFVDDISVEIAKEFDIAIAKADPAATNLGGAFTDVKLGNNVYIPYNNIDFADLKEWFYGAKIVNQGYRDILPTLNPRLRIQIDFDNGTGTVVSSVYSDSIVLDTILTNDEDGIVPTESLRDINFIQNNGEGIYLVKYWVEHEGIDANAANDTTRHQFTVTGVDLPYTNYLSKARLAASDGRVLATRPIFPGGSDFSEFEYGSMYYFPKGLTKAIAIDSVDFRYYIPNGFSGAAAQTIAVNIYNFKDGTGGGTATLDGAIDADGFELSHIGLSVANLSGLGSTVANGNYGLSTVSGFVNPGTGLDMDPFVNQGFYLITLQNSAAYNSVASFNSNSTIWFGADEYNYAINAASTDTGSLVIPNPSPSRVVDAAAVGSWNWVGFGADMVPSIGIYLDILYSGFAEVEQEENSLAINLYPNPTTDYIIVETVLEEVSDVLYILTDMSGRVLYMKQEQQQQQIAEQFDVKTLPVGSYLLTIKTEDKEKTKQFIKR